MKRDICRGAWSIPSCPWGHPRFKGTGRCQGTDRQRRDRDGVRRRDNFPSGDGMRRFASRCPLDLMIGARAIRVEASLHGHDVSPVPHENEPGAKFCEECAAPLAWACAKCGRPLSPTAKFCPECAHPTGHLPRRLRLSDSTPLSPTPPSTSARRSSPPRARWRASASRSPSSSPTSRARWSCWRIAIPRMPGSSWTPSSSG